MSHDNHIFEGPEYPIGYTLYTLEGFPTKRAELNSRPFLTVQEFWCSACVTPVGGQEPSIDTYTPVYRINIGIYSQVCDCCGKLVVDGVKRAKDNSTPLCLFGKTA